MLSMHDKCRDIPLLSHKWNIVSNLFSVGKNAILALHILFTTYKLIDPNPRGKKKKIEKNHLSPLFLTFLLLKQILSINVL